MRTYHDSAVQRVIDYMTRRVLSLTRAAERLQRAHDVTRQTGRAAEAAGLYLAAEMAWENVKVLNEALQQFVSPGTADMVQLGVHIRSDFWDEAVAGMVVEMKFRDPDTEIGDAQKALVSNIGLPAYLECLVQEAVYDLGQTSETKNYIKQHAFDEAMDAIKYETSQRQKKAAQCGTGAATEKLADNILAQVAATNNTAPFAAAVTSNAAPADPAPDVMLAAPLEGGGLRG